MDSAIVPIKDEKDRVVRYISVRLDITEKKRYEDDLQMAYQALSEANNKLEQLSRIDGLTGVANRRYFDEFLLAEISAMSRAKAPLTLILCDVDHFKEYNDAYGHVEGDACLRDIAATLDSIFGRASDLTARYGGEEFAIVLPGISFDEAIVLADKARLAVEKLGIKHRASGVAEVVTISIGFTTLFPDSATTVSELIERADRALYSAKEKGRNNVQFMSEISRPFLKSI